MPAAPQPRSSESRSTAIIADLSGSRDLDRQRRREVQDRLTTLLEGLNDDLQDAILSRFTVTLGDEFQGLLHRPGAIIEVFWRLRRELPALRLWTGVGIGRLDTPHRETAIGMDGPAFHNARQAVERARQEGVHGGVFVGFGSDDPVLTGLARLLEHHRESFTGAQFEAVDRVRSGQKQTEVAEALGVTPQAISKRVRSAGWDTYRAGEVAMRTLLDRHDSTDEWEL